MGADLYIKSISDARREKYHTLFEEAVEERDRAPTEESHQQWQEKVNEYHDAMYSEGYFRDSYNSTNILRQLGLSWWEDVIPMLDDEGLLSIHKTQDFLATVSLRDIPSAQDIKLGNFAIVDDGENSLEKWCEFFVQKRERLIEFLKLAIDTEEPIYCSL